METNDWSLWAIRASLLAAALMPIVCAGIAKRPGYGRRVSEGGYDNRDPRAWMSRQVGFSARANAAQANCFEALPFFYVAVLMATFTSKSLPLVAALCGLWLLVRSAYVAAYLADRSNLRSGVWVLGLLINAVLLFV
jgi:uncharacterized MAPEG superfamily protein